MATSCTIPMDVPLGYLNETGELIVDEETIGVQLLAVMSAQQSIDPPQPRR